jgi:hypothetical protein
MAAFDLGDLGSRVGASNKLPMGAGAYAGRNSLTSMRLPSLSGAMSHANPAIGGDAGKMPMAGGAGLPGFNLSTMTMPPQSPQPPAAASAPLAGLAAALKSNAREAGQAGAQDVLGGQGGSPAASAARPGGDSTMGFAKSPIDQPDQMTDNTPVKTLTRMVRGAY